MLMGYDLSYWVTARHRYYCAEGHMVRAIVTGVRHIGLLVCGDTLLQ